MSFRTAAVATCALVAGTVLGIPSAHAATIDVWTGQGDASSWSQAQNWSSGVPQAGDSVVIAPPGTQCHAHVVGAPAVALTDLTLEDNGDPASPCLASVSGAGFTVAGTLTWHGGVLDAPTTLSAGATGEITPTVDDTSTLTQDLTVDGTLTLTGNTYDGVDGPDRSLELQAGTALTVAPGGILHADGTNVVDATSCCADPARIVNTGTVEDTGSLTVDDVELDQDAVLDVAGADDEVVSLGAPNTASDGAQYTGLGDYRVTEASARDTLTGTQHLGPHFRFVLGGNAATSRVPADGNESLHGAFTFAGNGTVDWLGGEIAADMTVAPGVRLVAAGNVANGDDRELTDIDYPLDGGTSHPAKLTNHGSLAFSGSAAVGFSGNSRLVNTGTLTLAPGTSLAGNCCATQATVVNQGGAVSVPAGPGTTPVMFTGVGYSATGGSTSIGTGETLALTGGATSTLASTTVAGGTLRLASPVHLSKAVTVIRTVVQLRHGSDLEDVRRSGTTREAATLTGSGTLQWTAGTLRGLLTVHLAAVSVSGTNDKYVAATSDTGSASHVVIDSPLDLAAGGASPDVVQIENSCTVQTSRATHAHAGFEFFGGHVVNHGAFTVAAGTGKKVYVTGGASFSNSGTVDVASGTFALDNSYAQSAGHTVLARAAMLREVGSSSVVRISGGSLSGDGAVYGPVAVGAATLAPSGYGTLTVHGSLSTHSTSTLAVSVSRTRHGLLAVTGAVSLTGHLRVDDATTPHGSDRPAPVSSGGHLAVSRLCTTTGGAGSTGAHAHHWVATVSAHRLVLTWTAGRRNSC